VKSKCTLLLFIICGFSYACSVADENLPKLNDVQVIGSHNSYKKAIEPTLWNHLFKKDSIKAKSLQYDHIPIKEQLELGLRSLELDVFYDPDGGHFSNPKGLDIIRNIGENPQEFDLSNKLQERGFKMFHIQDIDFRSHHLLFKDCLESIKKWSYDNSKHLPLVILINTKDKCIDSLTHPVAFNKLAFDKLDQEIRSVFEENHLITPDYIRGNYSNLENAILEKGWPNLNNVKGKILFVLDEKVDKIEKYLDGHASLKGRVLFVNSKEGNAEAAFRVVNDPIKDFDYIKELVSKGYLVRTRADSGTKESRTNDFSRFEKAIESGAQIISTDYYIPTTLYPSYYKVSFDNDRYERLIK